MSTLIERKLSVDLCDFVGDGVVGKAIASRLLINDARLSTPRLS
jgi:hypothetical protein